MPGPLTSTSSTPKPWCKSLFTEVHHATQAISTASGRRPGDATAWLLLAICVAAALRVFRLGQNSLWVDELASLWVASLPLAQIPAAALQGNAFEPPVYFWLLHASIAMFGSSESALRALSVAAGILTVPLVWLLMREIAGSSRIAAFVALLLAVNPLHLWYSQEARPYSLSLLFGVASLLCLGVAMRSGRGVLWLGYTVFGTLAVLSHLTAIVVPAVGAGLVLLHEGRWRQGRMFVAFSAGIGLLVVPFLLALVNSIEPGSTGSPPRALTGLEAPYSLFTFVAGYSFGPSVGEIQTFGWREAVERHLGQTLIVGTVLTVIAGLVLKAPRRLVWPLGVLLIVPLAVPILGSWITSKAFNVRYTLLALIGFLGLVAVGVEALSPAARRAVFAALLVLSLWADGQWFLLPRNRKEDSRAAISCLASRGLGDSTVAVAPPYMKSVLEYYAGRSGHRMDVVGVSTADQLAASRASVLLMTRLHHVADEASLVRAFREGHDQVLEGELPGYRIYAVSSVDEMPSGGMCRFGE